MFFTAKKYALYKIIMNRIMLFVEYSIFLSLTENIKKLNNDSDYDRK